MNFNYVVLIFCFTINCRKLVTSASFKFTNVQCEDHDHTFSHFEKCQLAVLRRGVISLNIHSELLKSPVANLKINMALFRRTNGYVPYLFNVTADLCGFFADRERYPLLKLAFATILKDSNMNHTCPYYDNIILKNLVLEENMFTLLPLPFGQYMFKARFFSDKDLKTTVQVFFTSN